MFTETFRHSLPQANHLMKRRASRSQVCQIFRCRSSRANTIAESHQMPPYSNAYGDIWALGCILAEMISNVRLWGRSGETPREVNSMYRDYLMDRHVLFDILPISYSAYLLLRGIFSPTLDPSLRPSLADIRKKVMEIDTFFISEQEAVHSRWTRWLEETMEQKINARGQNLDTFRRPSETRSSCGSSSSGGRAFESSSAERRDVPLLPPALVVEGMGMGKKSRRLTLPQPRKRLLKRFAFLLK
jgi:serine/threonine protein kinase